MWLFSNVKSKILLVPSILDKGYSNLYSYYFQVPEAQTLMQISFAHCQLISNHQSYSIFCTFLKQCLVLGNYKSYFPPMGQTDKNVNMETKSIRSVKTYFSIYQIYPVPPSPWTGLIPQIASPVSQTNPVQLCQVSQRHYFMFSKYGKRVPYLLGGLPIFHIQIYLTRKLTLGHNKTP